MTYLTFLGWAVTLILAIFALNEVTKLKKRMTEIEPFMLCVKSAAEARKKSEVAQNVEASE